MLKSIPQSDRLPFLFHPLVEQTRMARVGIVFGFLLCGLTIAGMTGTLAKFPALFIPMMLGIPILFCGVVALNPHRRKHAMHAAASIGLLGAVLGGVRCVFDGIKLAGGDPINRYAWHLVIAMTVICSVFVAIAVVSFLQAHRKSSLSSDQSQ